MEETISLSGNGNTGNQSNVKEVKIKMHIKISKGINYLIVAQIFCCLFEEIIYSYNPNAGFVLLFPEIIGVLYFFLSIYKNSSKLPKISFNPTMRSNAFLLIFVLYVCMSIIWSSIDVYSILTRLRYILMGSIAYWIIHEKLTDKFYSKIINMMCIAQIINCLLVLYQFFIMKLDVDFCNGIFGFTGYANAPQGCFCIALSLLAFIYYINGTWKSVKSFTIVGISCIICAFSEIKVYFVLLVIGIVGIVAIRKNTVKEKIKIVGIGAVTLAFLYLAYKILLMILPQNIYALFSVSGYLSYDSRSTYAGRTNAIPFIYEHLFKNDFIKSLFGTGLGSSASEYIYELGKSFSEFGFVGLALIFLFLFSIFWYYFNPKRKNVRTQEQMFTAVYSGVFLVAMVVWNCTFTRFTYLNFFFLAISNVVWKEDKRNNRGVVELRYKDDGREKVNVVTG